MSEEKLILDLENEKHKELFDLVLKERRTNIEESNVRINNMNTVMIQSERQLEISDRQLELSELNSKRSDLILTIQVIQTVMLAIITMFIGGL